MITRRWFKKDKTQQVAVDVEKDLSLLLGFLNDLQMQADKIKPTVKKLLNLEKERQVATPSLQKMNLEAQAPLLEKLFQDYDFFQDDLEINALRLKEISKDFLKKADKADLDYLVKEKKKNTLWNLNW